MSNAITGRKVTNPKGNVANLTGMGKGRPEGALNVINRDVKGMVLTVRRGTLDGAPLPALMCHNVVVCERHNERNGPPCRLQPLVWICQALVPSARRGRERQGCRPSQAAMQ
jgi:hypothetical protein